MPKFYAPQPRLSMFLDIPLFGYMPLAALITYIPVFIRVAALKKLRRVCAGLQWWT